MNIHLNVYEFNHIMSSVTPCEVPVYTKIVVKRRYCSEAVSSRSAVLHFKKAASHPKA